MGFISRQSAWHNAFNVAEDFSGYMNCLYVCVCVFLCLNCMSACVHITETVLESNHMLRVTFRFRGCFKTWYLIPVLVLSSYLEHC